MTPQREPNLKKPVYALILAAGAGSRMAKSTAISIGQSKAQSLGGKHLEHSGESRPKQFWHLGASPVLTHSLRVFLGCERIDHVLVVIGKGHEAFYEEALACLAADDNATSDARDSRLLPPCFGAHTRQLSVLNGLKALSAFDRMTSGAKGNGLVLIHDGARPFVPQSLVIGILDALELHACAIPALPVVDSLAYGQTALPDFSAPDKPPASVPAILTTAISRDNLYALQTPQGFHLATITAAHERCVAAEKTDFGDDSALYRHCGGTCAAVAGARDNFKLTDAGDFARADALLRAGLSDIRTGLGYDVHRFCMGDHIMLGGVKIAHSHGLEGHSDADVLLHAITDALFGALGLPDIGVHFPPSDARWRGAASSVFLNAALRALAHRGGTISNIDAVIIAEAPKIAPHRAAICANIAKLCALEDSRVSLKATTSEGLGFTGRGEGMVAQATLTVRLP